MRQIDKTKPVMVSGATGYVAGNLIKKLLAEGLTVHATIRDPQNHDKLKYLNELAEESKGELKYFKSDLLEQGSFEEAMYDCELVFHTASPFINVVKDPQKNLVDPALIGTRNVLETANRTASVRRVVLTSSCVAILGDAKDLLNLPNGIATEANWNTSSNLHHQSYSYSKTLAEKEAWKINKAQNQWDLVVINPSLILGPGVHPISTSESFRIVKQMGDGTMKMGAPKFEIGMVDVRDVALAHFKAGFTPEAKGRYIISAENKSFLQLSCILQNEFGGKYPFPKKELPKFLVWLLAPTVGLKRKMVRKNLGYSWLVDNTKSKKELGMKYLPIEKSITDFFQQMVDNNIV
ncbi:NAD-dependent epimerase/dehydratase family protein [Ancylomarina longa]|uniref:NAD-dependent epimerase/dehydratase family protein n=1 Tax=Ancylomarina longa TaxID=2487017 RepID=A0A434ATR3_9BACT|nr:NAD-dependent epimerase/dehydratase family protein [Ancylomarina longa]RUT77794.1 NAD-dependent epimerase/dehydratase family protein [Ancylomarina longa]